MGVVRDPGDAVEALGQQHARRAWEELSAGCQQVCVGRLPFVCGVPGPLFAVGALSQQHPRRW